MPSKEDNKRGKKHKKNQLFNAWDDSFACRSSKLI